MKTADHAARVNTDERLETAVNHGRRRADVNSITNDAIDKHSIFSNICS